MLFNVIVTLLKQVCQGIVPYISELDKPSAVSLTCEKNVDDKEQINVNRTCWLLYQTRYSSEI